jgi:hypothetical protein
MSDKAVGACNSDEGPVVAPVRMRLTRSRGGNGGIHRRKMMCVRVFVLVRIWDFLSLTWGLVEACWLVFLSAGRGVAAERHRSSLPEGGSRHC